MTTISEARFAELAEIHGADFANWPAQERAAAETLAKISPQAASALAKAAQLDAVLADLAAEPAPAPSAALTARILSAAADLQAQPAPAARHEAAAQNRPFAGLIDWLFGGVGSAAACASAAAFGLWLGYAGPVSIADAATTMALGVEAIQDADVMLVEDSPFLTGLDQEDAE